MSSAAVRLPARASGSALRAARANPLATVCICVLALFVLGALLAPVIAPHDPNAVSLSETYGSPSQAHPLGTDASGRDLFSRLIWGARSSLAGPLLVIILASTLALGLALSAVWFGGWFDSSVSALLDVTFSFPGLLLAIGAVAIFGAGLAAPVVALGIAYTPYIARILRSAALRERHAQYVEALTLQGVGPWRIALRHLLPNLRTLVLAQCTLAFAYATIDLAAISYLGLGVQPPTADWGLMVAQGQPAILAGHPQEALYPSICLVLVALTVTLLGRQLARDAGESM
jgi:peptide/nickel transport system permease protein